MLAMIPMVVAAWSCGIYYTFKRMPEMPCLKRPLIKKAEIINLVKNLWTLIAVLLIIIIFNLSVCIATPLVIASNYIFDHFSLKDLPDLMVRSAEPILLGNMYLMLFKGILSYTGVIGLLPDFIGQFPCSMTIPSACCSLSAQL